MFLPTVLPELHSLKARKEKILFPKHVFQIQILENLLVDTEVNITVTQLKREFNFHA